LSEIERLNTLATRINVEHRRCEVAFRSGVEHALRAGELLIEAKDGVPHGSWDAWIADNFEGSLRTAQVYMRIARARKQFEDPKTQRVADLNLREAIKELSTPRPKPLEEDAPDSDKPALDTPPLRLSGTVAIEFVGDGIEAARALVEIRDRQLYTAEGYETFNDYLIGRFEIAPELFEVWEWFLGLPEQEQAGWLRELAIREWTLSDVEGNTEAAAHWSSELDRLEHMVRPVDVPSSRERDFLDNYLTYHQMHQTLAELVSAGTLPPHKPNLAPPSRSVGPRFFLEARRLSKVRVEGCFKARKIPLSPRVLEELFLSATEILRRPRGMILKVRRSGTVQRMMAHRKIQQNTDRTARTASNPAICGDIGRSALTTNITCADSFIARDPRSLSAGRMGGSACLAGLF
jgi:hypothetical protein